MNQNTYESSWTTNFLGYKHGGEDEKGINAYHMYIKCSKDEACWMHIAIIRPIITYGALVWGEAMNKESNRKSLAKERSSSSGSNPWSVF